MSYTSLSNPCFSLSLFLNFLYLLLIFLIYFNIDGLREQAKNIANDALDYHKYN